MSKYNVYFKNHHIKTNLYMKQNKYFGLEEMKMKKVIKGGLLSVIAVLSVVVVNLPVRGSAEPEVIPTIENPYTVEELRAKYDSMTKYRLEMPTVGISVDCVYTENNQPNVDAFDVIQASDVTSRLRFFGHKSESFKDLHNVKVGDEFTYNGETYIVVFSDAGFVTEDGTDIMSEETGELLLYEHDVEMITCNNVEENINSRWLVLADKKGFFNWR